jgi:hypothetical protein
MKRFIVDFTFTEMPSGRMYASESVDAGSLGMAVNNAYQQVRKRREFVGRRITTFKAVAVEVKASKIGAPE